MVVVFLFVSSIGRIRERCILVAPFTQEGEYFFDGEFLAADGVFDGDGRLYCSYKSLGNYPTFF
jgi:hypothetical protein